MHSPAPACPGVRRLALPALAALSLLGAPAAHARSIADAATCDAAQTTNAARSVDRALRCHANAAARGKNAPRSCAVKAIRQYLKALRKVDRRGTCLQGESATLAIAHATAIVETVTAALRPVRMASRCAAAKLTAAGAAGARLLAARGQARRSFDMPALQAAIGGAIGDLEGRFAAAEARGRCLTEGDFVEIVAILEAGTGLAGPLSGVVQIAKSIEFPADARPDVLANRSALEARGATVAADGSVITAAPVAAAGWVAVLGEQTARVEADGSFTLDVPLGTPLEGQLLHPSDLTTPMARFFVVELASLLETPAPIVLELATQGACGMNDAPADDPPSCHSARAAGVVRGLHAREAARLNPDPSQYPPRVDGELGTYPNPDPNAEQSVCLDYDGFIQTGERGEGSIKGAIAYPGSTCYKYVEMGCCDNEAATIRRHFLQLIDEKRFPVMACVRNHHGRFCQQLKQGDVTVVAKGQMARAGESIDVLVDRAENVTVNVHNNGCFGETHVSPGYFNDLGGVLIGDRYDGEKLVHWDDSYYYVDSPLTYMAPYECPSENASDKFEFEVDGAEATVTFHCIPTTTTTLPCVPGRDYSCP